MEWHIRCIFGEIYLYKEKIPIYIRDSYKNTLFESISTWYTNSFTIHCCWAHFFLRHVLCKYNLPMSLLVPIDNSSSKNSNIRSKESVEFLRSISKYCILHKGVSREKRLNGSIQATALSNQAQKEKTFHSCIQLYFFVVSIQSKKCTVISIYHAQHKPTAQPSTN